MPYCYHCPSVYSVLIKRWDTPELIEHVRAEHPEKWAEKMPKCPNCEMPCEAGRHPSTGWLCHYCNLWTDQSGCPNCGSIVPRRQIKS